MASSSALTEAVASPKPGLWRRLGRLLAKAVLLLALLAGGAWTATAIVFQVPESWRIAALAAALVVTLALLVLGLLRPLAGWLAFAAAALVVGLWWSSIVPSSARDWAPDVARGVTGEVNGNIVTLHNVRNFDWQTETSYFGRWETRTYNLDDLVAVDLFSSVWDNPAIAHTLISFGFANGDHVVFSAEIRKERDESFSEVGGFFKQFELVMIAADENDIIRLRTDARGEKVSMFPLKVSPVQMRALFLSYIAKANALAQHPQFYQTITTNCTTVIFRLARIIQPKAPFDWRILASGYLPGYLYDHEVIRTDLPLPEVTRRAVIPGHPARDGEAYSQAIRRGRE